MTRQAFYRILLSLLLLITQQMAASHAMSHWGAMLGAASSQARLLGGPAADGAANVAANVDDETDLSRTFALHHSCDKCLELAQFVAPLAGKPTAFAAPDLVDVAISTTVDHPATARTVCAFRSRAPPQA